MKSRMEPDLDKVMSRMKAYIEERKNETIPAHVKEWHRFEFVSRDYWTEEVVREEVYFFHPSVSIPEGKEWDENSTFPPRSASEYAFFFWLSKIKPTHYFICHSSRRQIK